MMYMYSRVLNNSTGAVDCKGGGKLPELVIVQYRINVDIITFKINNCTGLTLREKKKCDKKRVHN